MCPDISNLKIVWNQLMKGQPIQANIHPLVLLSIVDHFNRVNLSSKHKRVVGALLGTPIPNPGESNDGIV